MQKASDILRSKKTPEYFQFGSKKSLAREPKRGFSYPRESGHSLVVKRYPSKLDMRVRFPLPAPFKFPRFTYP